MLIALLFLARLRSYAKRTVNSQTVSLLAKIGIICCETNILTSVHCTYVAVTQIPLTR